MKFPHAYCAVKKLFIAEIISIAAAIFALITAILAAVASADPSTGVEASAATLALVSVGAFVAVFVLQLIALIQGGKDEDNFRTALWVTIVAIVIGIVSAVLQSIEATKNLVILTTAFEVFTSVAGIVVILLILLGISNLADELHDKELAEKGRRLATYIIYMFVVSALLSLIPSFFVNGNIPDFVRVMFSIFAIIAAVIELLIYINVLIFYRRAIRTLKK